MIKIFIHIFSHLEKYMDIKNQHVLVIGTQVPWIEAILLELGAKKVTILEYNDILSEHPQLFPIKPSDFAEKYLNGTLELFDAMVTFSSIEHSGLGTYGDSINPWGDLISMARAWCTLKPKGKALVGVPHGPDIVQVSTYIPVFKTGWGLRLTFWASGSRHCNFKISLILRTSLK